MFPVAAAIDNNSPNPFFPIPIEEAAANGIDIPSIVGFNSREGLCYLLGNKIISKASVCKRIIRSNLYFQGIYEGGFSIFGQEFCKDYQP